MLCASAKKKKEKETQNNNSNYGTHKVFAPLAFISGTFSERGPALQ